MRVSGMSTGELSDRRWRLLAAFLLLVSVIGLRPSVLNRIEGDVFVYQHFAEAWHAGQAPYAGFRLEYPPYFLPLLWLPSLNLSPDGFRRLFAAQMLAVDTLMKALLLLEGRRRSKGWLCFLPFAVMVSCDVALEYVVLKRFDLAPALLTVGAAVAFDRRREGIAGVMLGIGAGLKLYPAVLLPVLLPAAWRRSRAFDFLAGAALALVPLLAVLPWWPWWKLFGYHAGRGLQAESLYASLIWVAHQWLGVPAQWVWTQWASFEVTGSSAEHLLPVARALHALTLVASIGIAARRMDDKETAASAMLPPLLAFVAFNPILSPQYHLWLMPVAALMALHRRQWPTVALVAVATFLVPAFYPSKEYDDGLNRLHTVALLARNLTLVAAWVSSLRRFNAREAH